MDEPASSSRSLPKTANNANFTSKASSTASAAQELWVRDNEKELLKAIKNWKKAGFAPGLCPGTATRYDAIEGTDKDLPHNLGLIYNKYGRLHMHYKGCDSVARHWFSGWETGIEIQPIQRVIMCVVMRERLPGQSPLLERLVPIGQAAQNQNAHADSDEDDDKFESEEESEVPDEDHEVWSGEELTEKETVYSLDDSEEDEEKNVKKHQDQSDWVDVPGDGVAEGAWSRPKHDIPTVVKDAGRFFLEALSKSERARGKGDAYAKR